MKSILHVILLILATAVMSMADIDTNHNNDLFRANLSNNALVRSEKKRAFLVPIISFLLSDSAPVTLPSAPTSVVVTPVDKSSDELHVIWHDNASNESSFVIYRSESSNVATKVQVGTTGANSTTFTDNSLDSCKTYYYWVAAKNSAGESLSTSSGNGKTAPAAPTNFLAYKGPGIYQIHLDWDTQSCAASYNVYDLTNYTEPYELNASGITATEFTVERVLPTYTAIFYRVSSVDANGHEGAQSCRVVSTSPQAGATSQLDTCMAAVAWSVDPYIQNVWGSWNNYTDKVFIGWNSVPLTWNANGVAQSYAREYYVQISIDQTNWYNLNNDGSIFSHHHNPADSEGMQLSVPVSHADTIYYFRLYTKYYFDGDGDGILDYMQTSTPI